MGKKQEQELQAKVAELEAQLGESSQKLQEQESEVQREQQKLAEAERERDQLESTCEQCVEQREEQAELLQKSEEAAANLAKGEKEDKAELQSRAAAISKLTDELSAATKQLEVKGHAVDDLQLAQKAVEKHLAESEQHANELRRQCDEQKSLLEAERADRAAAHCFLDVSVSGCEFASAFAYSIQFHLLGNSQVRHTDVSPALTRPIFKISSVLLPTDRHAGDDTLQVSVFANIVDPVVKDAPPIQKLLGEASLKLTDLRMNEGSTTSSREVKSIEFVRQGGADAPIDNGQRLVVGRATLTLQVKTLTPSEVSGTDTARTHQSDPASLGPLGLHTLDRTLWSASQFQHRVCALVHRAEALPLPPEGGRATVRVALRLRRPDGQVLYESISTDMPIHTPGGTAASATVLFGQELLLPLKLLESVRDARVQLALEVISVAGSGGATNSALLDLNWPPDALPYFRPLHLHACPSDETSKTLSFARPRPSVLVSLVREPAHEHLDQLGDGLQHGVECRIHGVPKGRPLPDAVEDALLAICAEPASADAESPQIPIATFFYDQPLDLATFMKSHFQTCIGKAADFFLTPVIATSTCIPQWNNFVMRFLASPVGISCISIFLFQNGSRSDPAALLGGTLLGFASLDARSLRETTSSGAPSSRSFLLDLRLLEAPGEGSSVEVECRVWPRGDGQLRAQSDTKVQTNPGSARRVSPRPVSPGVAQNASGITEALGQEAHDFRLNHELSVQLAKEFNLRAAALKKAGEEIVGLRRQVQLLQGENTRLKGQLEDEERLAADVQRRPPPEGFDRLSSTELAAKLQRALEKYREEKTKGAELGRRLEDALKEASRGRGLQRTLGELENAHMQQNKELQRLQDENKKIDKYRQAAKTQEKVIAKLEKILEGSLQEIQKAQRVQVDMEKLKTENLRLREKCAELAARRRGAKAGEDDADDLARQLSEKDQEVAKLEAIVRELRSRPTQPPATTNVSPELAAERRKLGELQDTRLEWEQRCIAAEHRLSMLEQQLTESSKRYGGEITALQVEVAKRDAKVLELEFLLKEQGAEPLAP